MLNLPVFLTALFNREGNLVHRLKSVSVWFWIGDPFSYFLCNSLHFDPPISLDLKNGKNLFYKIGSNM